MSVDSVTKSFDSETEMQGLSRVDFVLRSLAGEQRSEALIVVAHAITLAAAAALGSCYLSLNFYSTFCL